MGKLRGQYSSFLSYVGGVLESLSVFNLDWIKVRGYHGGKMGSWGVRELHCIVMCLQMGLFSLGRICRRQPIYTTVE